MKLWPPSLGVHWLAEHQACEKPFIRKQDEKFLKNDSSVVLWPHQGFFLKTAPRNWEAKVQGHPCLYFESDISLDYRRPYLQTISGKYMFSYLWFLGFIQLHKIRYGSMIGRKGSPNCGNWGDQRKEDSSRDVREDMLSTRCLQLLFLSMC